MKANSDFLITLKAAQNLQSTAITECKIASAIIEALGGRKFMLSIGAYFVKRSATIQKGVLLKFQACNLADWLEVQKNSGKDTYNVMLYKGPRKYLVYMKKMYKPKIYLLNLKSLLA